VSIFSYWNVWGTDNVGKINANGDKFFYIKDHLGSVRVVLNSDNQIVSAIDYDCWGYPLENRSYQSDDIDYKFTGKQRDAETGYDYFGARYYDARIGRWGGVEPLLEKYISFSGYSYGVCNPMTLKDVDGKWIPEYNSEKNTITVKAERNDNLKDLYTQLNMSSEEFATKYGINDIDKYEIKEGITEFDITDRVISKNSGFSQSELSELNCFSSVFVGSGASDEEIMIKGGEGFSNSLLGFGFKESDAKTGSVVTWEDDKGVTWHVALYVIKSNSGGEYYLGRPGIGAQVSLQSSKDIKNIYPNFVVKYFKYSSNDPVIKNIDIPQN